MFLEIKGITKHFGDGESRVNVLKGIDVSMEKRRDMCASGTVRIG